MRVLAFPSVIVCARLQLHDKSPALKCGAFCVAWFIGMRLRALASCTGESRILALSKRGADQAVVGKIAKPQHDERRKYRACQIGCISAKYITQRIDACKQR